MISFIRTPAQIRKTLLLQKRFALVGATIFIFCFVPSLLMTLMALIVGEREWIVQWLALVVLSVPFLLFNSMFALHVEFKGWKLVNGISTKAEGATFAAFRADNGLKKTLRFRQCGFKRGEK